MGGGGGKKEESSSFCYPISDATTELEWNSAYSLFKFNFDNFSELRHLLISSEVTFEIYKKNLPCLSGKCNAFFKIKVEKKKKIF